MTALDQKAHKARIDQEMRAAGLGWFARQKFGPRYVHTIIHPDEHIRGMVYGRYRETKDSPAWEEGTLVATDRRVMFVDRKPGYLRAADIPYDMISGVQTSRAGMFGGVTLFTRDGTFAMNFVRNRCREQFIRYVENRRLESVPD